MTIVIPSGDCGNSPKNIFLENLTVAFAKGDAHFILSSVTDDILWNILGQKLIQGKKDFAQAVEQMKNERVEEITIHHVVTHGKAGAVNGTVKLENGRTCAFCDVYEFSNAKGRLVREITSYLIEIN